MWEITGEEAINNCRILGKKSEEKESKNTKKRRNFERKKNFLKMFKKKATLKS